MRQSLFAIVLTLGCVATGFAGLDTATYVGYGFGYIENADGRTNYLTDVGQNTGAYDGSMPVTIGDIASPGGDIWNGGDTFMYLHDDDQYSGATDFSAQVRVVSQTAAQDGRWGKAGLHARASLDSDSSNVTTQVATGSGSQLNAPLVGDHNPVPVVTAGRSIHLVDNQSGFEIGIPLDPSSPLEALDPLAAELQVANNFFGEDGSTTSVWLSLDYTAATGEFVSGIADDVAGVPGVWNFGAPVFLDTIGDDGDFYVGLAYSAHEDMQQHMPFPQWTHGVTFDNYSITPDNPVGLNCDFDVDGNCDLDDIDSLIGEIVAGTNDAAVDINGDGVVDTDDRDDWLTAAGANNLASGNSYILGDANLDGVVDVSDFNVWNGAKFTSTATWSQGDFNADGVSDVSDFNIWNGNKFTSALDGTAAVPEPSSFALLGLAVCGMLGLRRRR